MLEKILHRLQWDQSLGYALVTRGWQAISGPITIVFLIQSLNLSEQGIYYSIIGIVGIQAYFELGLLNVLVSQSGHAAAAIGMAHQEADAAGVPVTQHLPWVQATSRMRDLIRASTLWFGIAALLYVAIAILFGWFTLSDSNTAWQIPLLGAIQAAAIVVAFAPWIALLEGAGFRDLVYRYRLIQMIIGSLAVWGALALGLKLWSIVLASVTQAVVSLYLVCYVKRDFFLQFRKISTTESTFAWMREVVPVQWRVALITASFHFATQFFTIIVCKFHGDSEAAPLGMTLSITSAIQMVALAWVQTKYPVISAHHGKGDRELAGTLWRQISMISTVLLLLGFATLTILILLLPNFDTELSHRFLNPSQVLLLAIGGLANHIAAIQGFYVLSMKAKPLLAASLFGSIPTAISVWCGGYLFSTNGVLIGYAVGMGVFLVPAHTLAYLKFRKTPTLLEGSS